MTEIPEQPPTVSLQTPQNPLTTELLETYRVSQSIHPQVKHNNNQETRLSDVYRRPTYQSALKEQISLRPHQPSTTPIQPQHGAIETILDRELPISVSSNQSHWKNPLIKTSRFVRVMETISHFLHDNWFIIRPIMIFIGVIVGVMIFGPVFIGMLV